MQDVEKLTKHLQQAKASLKEEQHTGKAAGEALEQVTQ